MPLPNYTQPEVLIFGSILAIVLVLAMIGCFFLTLLIYTLYVKFRRLPKQGPKPVTDAPHPITTRN